MPPVSSSLLARVAEQHGALSLETLTGFKWIANAAIAHDGPFGTINHFRLGR